MHPRSISYIKLIDIAARTIFVLMLLYLLPNRDAGQFGLALTLGSLFSFVCGFERYVDLQRQLVGCAAQLVDRKLFATLWFFIFNYVLWLPILSMFLILWAHIDDWNLVLYLIIAIVEHLSNEVYRLALIETRYRHLLWVSLIKNLVLLLVMCGVASHNPNNINLTNSLLGWASLSIVVALFGFYLVRRQSKTIVSKIEMVSIKAVLIDGYKNSLTHFIVGAVAVLSVQVDRLIVGGLLDLDNSGIYFRHVMLASVIYQATGVLSHNRILFNVYDKANSWKIEDINLIIRRELFIIVPSTLMLISTVLLIGISNMNYIFNILNINSVYLAALLFGYLLRTVADYKSLVLNAGFKERYILRSQIIALCVVIPVSVILTTLYDNWGAIISVNVGALTILILLASISVSVKNLKD